jgi:hypothetical protein
MNRIQELAEALVNLTAQEVNELSMVMKNEMMDMPAVQYVDTPDNHILSPKEYGMKLMKHKNKRK